MKPLSRKYYFKAAQEIWNSSLSALARLPPYNQTRPILFLGSEDPAVISQALSWYFSMLLNLDGIIRCQGFVFTMGSNFCRVADELRSSVANR